MDVTAISGNSAYTDKGNQYKRFSCGKKVGAAALPAVSLIGQAVIGGFKKENTKVACELLGGKGKYAACVAAGLAILAAVGTGIGAIVDACVNKVRKNKADEAALKNM